MPLEIRKLGGVALREGGPVGVPGGKPVGSKARRVYPKCAENFPGILWRVSACTTMTWRGFATLLYHAFIKAR